MTDLAELQGWIPQFSLWVSTTDLGDLWSPESILGFWEHCQSYWLSLLTSKRLLYAFQFQSTCTEYRGIVYSTKEMQTWLTRFVHQKRWPRILLEFLCYTVCHGPAGISKPSTSWSRNECGWQQRLPEIKEKPEVMIHSPTNCMEMRSTKGMEASPVLPWTLEEKKGPSNSDTNLGADKELLGQRVQSARAEDRANCFARYQFWVGKAAPSDLFEVSSWGAA